MSRVKVRRFTRLQQIPVYTVRHEGQLLIIPDSNAEIDNYVTNMTSSILLLSDECHEETAIMSSHSSGSMVIGELKALQLILAYSLESTLKGRLVITAAPRKYTAVHI